MTPLLRGAALAATVIVSATTVPAAAGNERGPEPSEVFAGNRDGAAARVSMGVRRRGADDPAPAPARPAPESRSALTPVNEGGFNAIAGGGGIAPSDTTGAAGASRVVTAVNIEYAVWDKAAAASPIGSPSPLVAGTLESLYPGLPGGTLVFDPKVVYDPYRGRFVLAFLAARGPPFGPGSRQSWILVVSIPEATASDPATWCRRRLQGDQIKRNGDQFADYPGLGLDRDRVYVTTNQFTFSGAEEFEYAQILALRKTSLYRCRGPVRRDVFGGRATRDPERTPAFTIQPAITETDAGANPPEFLVSFQDRSCGNACGKRLTVWRITERRGDLRLAKDSVNVGRGAVPPFGTQKDGSATCFPIDTCWDVGDLRLTHAFYDADRGRLYTAHAIRKDLAPGDRYVEAVVRWYEIDPSPIARSRVTRRGILGDPGRDAGWPSMVTDGAGNLFVNYSRAGAPLPGEYISAVAATIPPGVTGPDSVVVLAPGEALYVKDPGQPQRWGDFSAANRDPLDPLDVWLVNQFARSDGSPPTNLWQQTVHRVSFG